MVKYNNKKMKMKKILLSMLTVATLLLTSSCENSDIEFGDFEYQTVYFARQTPVRTITLGDDVYDTSLDNAHKFQIYATLGGVEKNKKDRLIQFVVDKSLCDGLTFSDGSPVQVMPSEYYSLSSNTITIPSGNIMGAVDVQLTDAFFADSKSIDVTYIVPLRMTACQDSILSGTAKDGVTNPNRLNSNDWSTSPKDYILYAVKYKNKWHGAWISQSIIKTEVICWNIR